MPSSAARSGSFPFGKSLLLALTAMFLVAVQQEAHGYSNSPASITGRTNKSGGSGCTSCHGASADGTITVTISGPTALNKGQLGLYTVTATKSGIANGTKMGLAVAASDSNPLTTVTANTVITSEEMIHASGGGALNTTTSNSASYQFNYTMPAGAAVGSSHTLYSVAVLAYPGSWNHAANFTVVTRPVAPTSVTPSNATAGSVDLSWSGTGPEYRVVYKTGASAPTTPTDGTALDLGTATSTTVNSLAASTQYSFAVFSKISGQSVFSSTAATTTATTTSAVVATRYVNAATGTNAGACTSSASPCKTITYAMSQASTGNPGDTINVADGTYNVALGETFPIVMKSGVQLLGDGGAAVVDATGANNRVFNVLACNANTKITGLTIMGGLRQPAADGSNSVGGAMLIDSASSIRVGGNVFSGNEARGYAGNSGGSFPSGGQAYGGAIYVNSGSTPTIVNNVFKNNIVRGGHGVDYFGSSTNGGSGGDGTGGAISAAGGTIVNNTFYGNKAIGGAGGFSLNGAGGSGGGAHSGGVDSNGANVYNNIFAANDASRGAGGSGGSSNGVAGFAGYGSLQYSSASASNNLFFQSTVDNAPDSGDTRGSGFVLGDPLFHLAPSNVRVGVSSPASAAGTNTGLTTLDFDGVTRPNPPAIGAFEPAGAYLQMTDLNGDNRSDLLYRNTSTGQVWRFLMNGMSITQGAMAYVEPNTAWKIISDADFNGDGINDLLYRNDVTGQVYVLFMNSSGLTSGGGLIYTEPNLNWKIIQTPDIDGDGKADLLWWNSATGQVYVMLMNGLSIGTQALVYTEPNVNWKIVGVGDFAGSGKQNQLLWYNGSTGQVYLMTLVYNGSGFTQSGQTIYYANTQYKVVGIADFNGDGKHDVLWRNDSTGQLYIFLMNNAQIAFEGVIYQEANLAWKVVAVGDYNGDGRADILYRNDSNGMVWMLLMNGASVASQGLAYQEGNTAWRILGPLDYAQ